MTAWRERARRLREDVVAVALAIRDPRVPWHARALGALIVAYALSPIDLIPDFVPVIGYLDDLVLVPLGLTLMPAPHPGGRPRRASRGRRRHRGPSGELCRGGGGDPGVGAVARPGRVVDASYVLRANCKTPR
jgi:uncharacterized membrane protein YkvA (DUF1232 family)